MSSIAILPVRGVASRVSIAGAPLVALYAYPYGGYVTNPQLARDQGLSAAEVLYVDLTGPAALAQTSTTTALQPGQSFSLPAGSTLPLWVSSATPGHTFVSVGYTAPTGPLTPVVASFPPSGQVTMTQVIPSYLYEEYSDDSDLQAFVSSYNQLAQTFLNTVVGLNLPIYTADVISGALLDWVAQGLYGIVRPPVLYLGPNTIVGQLNTYELNAMQLDAVALRGPSDITVTTDDIFKRIITWAFFKGDGKVFNVRWLKRRVMRFLLGTNGTAPPIDETNQISVTFGADASAEIRFIDKITTVTGAAIMNGFEMNAKMLDELDVLITPLTPLPYRLTFKEAVNTGVIELPFMFNWTVTI